MNNNNFEVGDYFILYKDNKLYASFLRKIFAIDEKGINYEMLGNYYNIENLNNFKLIKVKSCEIKSQRLLYGK